MQTQNRFGETTILQTCPHVGSYAAIWQVNRDSDVLNRCSCRNNCVTLPSGSCLVAPRAQPHRQSPGFCWLCGGCLHTMSQGTRRLAETWWQSQETLAGCCRLQVVLHVPDALCEGTGGSELQQSHPALSHLACSCISFQVNSGELLSCYADPRAHLFPKVRPLLSLYIHSATDFWHFTDWPAHFRLCKWI